MAELAKMEAKLEVIADWLDLRGEDSEGKDLSVHMMGATSIIREVIGGIDSTYTEIDRLALSIRSA